MFLKSVYIDKFKVLENISIEFNKSYVPTIYPLASLNGGGKSTFLQLIFILIYTSFSSDKSKIVYLQNLLKGVVLPEGEDIKLFVKLEFLDNDNELHYIEYYIANNNFADFNSYIKFEVAESQYIGGSYQRSLDESKDLKDYLNNNSALLDRSERKSSQYRSVDMTFRRRLHKVVQQGDTQHRILFQRYEDSETVADVILLLTDLIDYFEEKVFRLVNELEEYTLKKNFLIQKLKEDSYNYITNASKECFLLYKTDMKEEELKVLSEKIFLVAPNTQVFSFLNENAKKALFLSENIASKEELDISEFYDYHVRNSKKYLNNFFTYEFASTTLIINSFKKARDKDFEDAVATGHYGENLTKLRDDLNDFLLNKSISVDKDLKRVIFKLRDNDKELSPEDLSHGELKKLGLFIWLKYKHLEGSIILMDEVENGLHPDWQFSIIGDLGNWSPSNQFILATHSYEICDALTPSHVSELNPKLLK